MSVNTVSIANRHPGVVALAAANAASPIMFPVGARPLAMVGKEGRTAAVKGHKAIARVLDGEPVCLGVVGDNYGLVTNKAVLAGVERELLRHIPGDKWADLQVKDKLSYSGAFCEREYLFKGFQSVVTTESGFETKAALSFLFRNSYDGSSGVFFGGSVVDLVCINGLIGTRWQENINKRHTAAAASYPYEKIVTEVISRYQREVAELTKLGHHSLKGKDDKVVEFLKAHFAERTAERLLAQYQTEKHFRGTNAFALLSALTFYGSHESENFRVRRTGNDNVMAALAKRQDEISELIHGGDWHVLVNAA
jgi:hypothetical protein